MTSAALVRWQTERSDLLDHLFGAHALVGGRGVGRRWMTVELNRALVLRLAAQFQGFARDLHHEAASSLGRLVAPDHPEVAQAVTLGLQAGRELDRRSAQPDALARDFRRLGIDLWPAMTGFDRRTPARRDKLAWLHTARNAIAHEDEVKLALVVAAGHSMHIRQLRDWRRALDGLVGTMDRAVEHRFTQLFPATTVWQED